LTFQRVVVRSTATLIVINLPDDIWPQAGCHPAGSGKTPGRKPDVFLQAAFTDLANMEKSWWHASNTAPNQFAVPAAR
jgi:hypothetical protein